jgi:hypothetical protein
MLIFIGVWFALGGGLAALAGLSGLHRARRLRRDGIPTWAVTVAAPVQPEDLPGRSPRMTMLQYAPADGQVIERLTPRPARRKRPLSLGEKVLVWYDPADPQDVLVYGRDGRIAELGYVLAGTVFVLAGGAIAAFSH